MHICCVTRPQWVNMLNTPVESREFKIFIFNMAGYIWKIQLNERIYLSEGCKEFEMLQPDPMTSKRVSVSTLGYHWAYHTGRPLEPQVHWDATGTTLADARSQWCPSGDTELICIIGTHWNTTGRPLEAHRKHTGNALATTTNISFSSGIPVYTGSELPLAQDKGSVHVHLQAPDYNFIVDFDTSRSTPLEVTISQLAFPYYV